MKRRKTLKIIIAAVLILSVAGGLVYALSWYPLKPVPDMSKARIACIGDSITYGAGVFLPLRNRLSYPAYLQELAGEEYQVLNYGLSGRTLLDEGDMPYRQEKFFPLSKDAQASVYIIMLGTNDSKPFNWNRAAYETELADFISEYRDASPEAEVYVMLPPKAFPLKSGSVAYDISDDIIREEVIPVIREVCGDMDIPVIDLYSLTETHPEWFGDGVHPNSDGNRHIAEYIFDSLQTA